MSLLYEKATHQDYIEFIKWRLFTHVQNITTIYELSYIKHKHLYALKFLEKSFYFPIQFSQKNSPLVKIGFSYILRPSAFLKARNAD